MSEDRLHGALEENVLTLLCFSAEYAPAARGILHPDLFDSAVYRDIASRACEFLDLYSAPIQEHLPDLFDHILHGEDSRKARAYEQVFENLHSAANGMNDKYVFDQLTRFVRQQRLKAGVVEAVDLIKAEDLDAAEQALQKAMRSQLELFDPGVFLNDSKRALAFLDQETPGHVIGIKPLDDAGVQPAPGELFTFMAPPKRGKTWFLIHVAKYAVLQRLKVLHISLEMSEVRMAQRYMQSFFSMTKRPQTVRVPQLQMRDGQLESIDMYELENRPSMQDPGIRAKLHRDLGAFMVTGNLLLKRFPTRSLSFRGLVGYLDSLAAAHRYHPDVLLLDYPDLMEVDVSNLRLSIGALMQDLRGLAVERNFALVAPTQGNRESANARIVTEQHVAEDWSKIAIADIVLTYSQTEEEKRFGLARLFVSNSRNDEGGFQVVISQAYAAGQFAMDSVRIDDSYWSEVESLQGIAPPDEDD